MDIDEFVETVIAVDTDNLKEELLKLPADLARYNALHASAYNLYLSAKQQRESVFADLITDPDFINELEEKLGKKPNLDQVKAAITRDDEYGVAKSKEIKAEIQVKRALGCVDAIREKSRMLQMATALIRDELNAEDEFSD